MEFKIINPTVIQESMMHSDELIKQFIELYLFQCPLDFEVLTTSISQKNLKEIAAAAHHIKPTMEYIGASNLRVEFQELENLSNKGASIEEIEAHFLVLKPKFELMLVELAHFNT